MEDDLGNFNWIQAHLIKPNMEKLVWCFFNFTKLFNPSLLIRAHILSKEIGTSHVFWDSLYSNNSRTSWINLHTTYAEYTGEFKQKKYRNKSKKIPTQLLMVRLYKIYLLDYHSSSFNPSECSQFQKYWGCLDGH